jgi:hypothetical protein
VLPNPLEETDQRKAAFIGTRQQEDAINDQLLSKSSIAEAYPSNSST